MKYYPTLLFCHGIPNRCYKVNGKYMTWCARCVGASIGHVLSAAMYFFYFLPSLFYPLIGLVIIFMDWFLQNRLLCYHSNHMRLITGLIGGFSVGIFSWKLFDILIQVLWRL